MTLVASQAVAASLQENTDPSPSIVSSITETEGCEVVQPAALADRVLFHQPKVEPPKKKVDSRAGFRVQIFSDGNQTTARNNARARIRQVSARFPQWGTYLTSNLPYWRARVGDFKTREEANSAAAEIRRAFPSFSNEVRVVSDRISIRE